MSNDKVMVTKNKISAIADKIREKSGEDTEYTLDMMPSKIDLLGNNYTSIATLILGEETE